eukprot:TRINITY_DN6025_c0_g1_i1.p1 TRINITY_DN6025_c0_g1~~TRINITY_DN6025_c0_g1_i1.p1  ORF type:complete len:427 (-),score=152.90 TRINITY_DN6025_c0_g1_i1:14-1294(-)
MKTSALLFFFAVFCVVLSFAASEGKRTLVVVDDLSIKDTHSAFFKSLASRGYNLKFVTGETADIGLRKYGEFLYDNLILFAPKAENVDDSDVNAFIDAGGNVLIAADTGVSDKIREIARGVGADFAETFTSVIDHHSYDQSDSDGHHTTVLSDHFIQNTPAILKSKPAPVLFRGIGHDGREGSLNYRLLTASGSAYSGRVDGKSANLRLLGKKNTLVSALQARNGARVVVSGSLALFSDAFFNAQVKQDGKSVKSGNELFSREVSEWVFGERAILRFRDIQHSREAGDTPAMYTIKENIKYSVIIEERSGDNWVPFKANDVQLEFIMIDPYVRTNLTHDNNGKYSTSFKIPDVYGVYTFKVEYNRPGYTPLLAIERAPVRPFRHDQYERFIPSAFPYYAGAFSMLVGLFVFSVVFLYHKEDTRKRA